MIYDIYVIGVSIVILFGGFILGHLSSKIFLNLYGLFIKKKPKDLNQIKTDRKLEHNLGSLIANLIKYFIYGLTLVVLMDFLGFTPLSQGLLEFVKYIPNIIGAIIILFVGFIAGEVVENLIFVMLSDDRIRTFFRGFYSEISYVIGIISKYYVYFLAITMAIGQLGFSVVPLQILIATISLALVGVLLITLYLSLKDSLINILTGEYLFERDILREGNTIVIPNLKIKGKIVSIGGIYTKIKSKKGYQYVPNKILMNSTFEVSKK